MTQRLEGKTAIITGATSGIGRATVERFAEEGAQVVFCGRREQTGKEIEKNLKKLGYDVYFVKADCTVDADLENLVAETIARYGKIDILFNNAGILRGSEFEHMDMEVDFEPIFKTNVRSHFVATKLVIPHMLKVGSGSIVNTASMCGSFGLPNIASYCASKAAVIMLTRTLAKEFGARGIRTNCVSPGRIYTEMMPRETTPTDDVSLSVIPMRRYGEAREIANAVLFLASDDASFCNGANLAVDGGETA